MTFKLNPLTKIIGLSSVLALGFLLVVLAGALYANWFPIVVAVIFSFAHIPILVTKYYSAEFDSYLDDPDTASSNDVTYMFCTFDNKLSALDTKQPRSQHANLHVQAVVSHSHGLMPKTPRIHNKSFVGTTSRSKNGCLNCRQKKKKCDEAFPACGLCVRSHVQCVRRDKKTKSDKAEKAQPIRASRQFRQTEQSLTMAKQTIPEVDDDFAAMDESQMIENLYLNDQELIRVLQAKDIRNHLPPAVFHLFTNKISPAITVPSSVLVRSLDETGRLFLDHFISYITATLTACPKKVNPWSKFIIQMAAHDDAILNGVVAWGGMFLVGHDNDIARRYLARCTSLTKKKRQKALTERTIQDYLSLATCFIVLMGSQISTGDIKFWYHMFLQFKDVFTEYGGVLKFIKDNKHLKEARWIVSYFFFHDINTIRTAVIGTHVEMDTYKEIFQRQKLLEMDEYGIDPFQGSAPEIFLILGEILCKKKELNDFKTKIWCLELSGDPSVGDEIMKLQLERTELSWTAFEELETMILQSRPSLVQLEQISHDTELLTLHLTLFELLQIVMQLYLRIAIHETDFRDEEIVRLRNHAGKLLDLVIGTSLQVFTCLVLMILGVVSYDEKSRKETSERSVGRSWTSALQTGSPVLWTGATWWRILGGSSITDPDTLWYVLSHNHESWGGKLSVDEYCEREQRNYTHRLCDLWRDPSVTNGTYYWVLKDTALSPTDRQDIVCACEFLVRDSYYFDTELRACKSAVVGSVYTLKDHRKKGYATKMLAMLVDKMKEILTGEHDFTFLYSEVGEFYAQFGYKSANVPLAELATGGKTDIQYTPIRGEQLAAFVDQYDRKLQALVRREPGSVAVKPSPAGVEWFHNRSVHLAGLQKRQFDANCFGLNIGNAFVIWYYEFATDRVTILMLDAETKEQVKQLLECCICECSGVKKIRVWHDELVYHGRDRDPDVLDVVLELGGRINLENESLPAIGMLHSEKTPVWIGNSKWPWNGSSKNHQFIDGIESDRKHKQQAQIQHDLGNSMVSGALNAVLVDQVVVEETKTDFMNRSKSRLVGFWRDHQILVVEILEQMLTQQDRVVVGRRDGHGFVKVGHCISGGRVGKILS
ncbi:hypothetical protein OGAPHI_005328 [Ogataea philodendri]|uniref:Zn(2)-C6 fungal-type domain-containing protein n=1 Tax=Ogataea philodendri TaxID=1378263 RepID=A0A9P8P011_9ASCO|nr:uncharacterized protein OGAPHI_005328 [Ogataea philodendri]KAH3663338.1 hypothetical protein OGAPHI_005328 [Ogataea philodendri]